MSMPTGKKVTFLAEKAVVLLVVVVGGGGGVAVVAFDAVNLNGEDEKTMTNFYASLARHRRRQSSRSKALLPYLLLLGRVTSPCVDE